MDMANSKSDGLKGEVCMSIEATARMCQRSDSGFDLFVEWGDNRSFTVNVWVQDGVFVGCSCSIPIDLWPWVYDEVRRHMVSWATTQP